MIWAGMLFFSRYLPTEIPNLHKCLQIYGGLVRLFMNIQIKLHYVTMIQILLLWYGSLSHSCQYNVDLTILELQGGKLSLDAQMGQESNQLLEVAGLMWILMHVIGGIIRSMVHIEPYYDIPEDPDESQISVLLFQRCGP